MNTIHILIDYRMEIVTFTLLLSIIASMSALLYGYIKASWIKEQEPGSPLAVKLAEMIADGARAFLKREYKILAIFVVMIALLMYFINEGDNQWIALSIVLGALCSGAAGFFGMKVATLANVRTAFAATKGLNPALKTSFAGGTVMGMAVEGLGLGGLTVLLYIYTTMYGSDMTAMTSVILPNVNGFAMGASSVALFARVAGGIYTKAADVGADLFGKVEEDLPEDSIQNPMTVADNVGDNVGDVAGMGADLFESKVGVTIATMVLGSQSENIGLIFLPLVLYAVGIFISIFSTFFVSTKEGGNPQSALDRGTWIATFLMILSGWYVIPFLINVNYSVLGIEYTATGVFWCIVIGSVAGLLIGKITEFFTSSEYLPVKLIVNASETGGATNIITGISVGYISIALPVILIAVAMVVSYMCGGFYGISIAGLGMLLTNGIQLAVDAYGPIADNAGGIATMSGLPDEVRERTDKLDSVGNTTAAIGKGFAIGSAALTAVSLFAAFCAVVGINSINIVDPFVLAGLIVGGMIPYIFSGLTISAVGKAANAMVLEGRNQFNEIEGLRELKEGVMPNSNKCIDIATGAAIKGAVIPGLLVMSVPILFGMFGGPEMLGGYVVSVTLSGIYQALFMSNTGGAWDNAKKAIESMRNPRALKEWKDAAVIGDTVGDPFKDTSGPSLNIVMKLTGVIALVIAPFI